jgi:tetratricopeptide (TPR) repeat protein
LYAVYVQNEGRLPEAMDLLRRTASHGADTRERALAMNAYAANLMEEEGQCREAIPLLQRAEALNAGLVGVQANLSNAFYCLGRDQQAFDASLREAQLLRKMKEELIERRRPQLLLEHEAVLAGQLGDYRRRFELYEQLEWEGHGDRSIEQAMALADNYDVRGSLREYSGTVDRSVSRRPWLRFKQLWALEQWAAAAAQLKALNQVYESWGAYVGKQIKTQNLPLVAIALAKAGGSANVDEARSLVGDMPADCYLCVRARGIVAAVAGDHAEADRQFGKAVAIAPRLPFAYLERGEALFARGKVEEARRLFVKAHETGPGWADPLKAWGDARLAAGDAAGAALRYASAAERAPRWGALHIEWGKALWHSGRRAEAHAKFRDAAEAGLSARNLRRALRFRCIAENSLRAAGTAEQQCPPLPG